MGVVIVTNTEQYGAYIMSSIASVLCVDLKGVTTYLRSQFAGY